MNALNFLAAVSMLACVSNCLGATQAGPRSATTDDVREVNSRMAAVFATREDFPESPVSAVRLEKTMYWSGKGENALLLIPVTVRFRGVSNSYCRFVTTDLHFRALTLIQLPAQANFDDCSGIDQIRYMDVNGDGLLDVIETVKVQSNVQDGMVATALVYISSPRHAGGYCYSSIASRQLAPADMLTDAGAARALARNGQVGCDH